MKPRTVPVSKLDLDQENSRLAVTARSQEEALHAMLEEEGASILGLARDIAKRGMLNPAEPLIVVADGSRYTVLEGNRRLCALRLLKRPSLALTEDHAKFARVAKSVTSHVQSVSVMVAGDRDEADDWIEMKHSGPGAGAGIRGWGSRQKQTFKLRRTGQRSYVESVVEALQEWYPDNETLMTDMDVVIHGNQYTNLERILDAPEAREALGLRQADGLLESRVEPSAILPFFENLMKALAHPEPGQPAWSRVWGNKDQRKAWLEDEGNHAPEASVMNEDFVFKSIGAANPESSAGVGVTGGAAANPAGRRAGVRDPFAGPKLHFGGITVHSDYPVPVRKLASELATLNVITHPNTTVDVLRSFVEKTIKSYARLQGEVIESPGRFVQFSDCLNWLERHVVDHPELRNHRGTVQKMKTSRVKWTMTADAFNAANHNDYVVFSATDAKDAWAGIRDLMKDLLARGTLQRPSGTAEMQEN